MLNLDPHCYDNVFEPLPIIDTSKFYVIAVCSNPVRYHRRWHLFKQFEAHVQALGAKLIIVEQAYGHRDFILTQRDDPYDVQIRTRAELWHKENMINIGIAHLTQLDPDWKYVAWVDGDIHFNNMDIISETAHQLQHYDIVQMFSHAIDLGPKGEPLATHQGFAYSYFENDNFKPQGAGYGGYYAQTKNFWHPGFAWAARRDALEKICLFDKAILGAGDHHMALCLIGCGEKSLPKGVSKDYRNAVMSWQEEANAEIKRNIGYVPGTILHHWHGAKKNRKYVERWKVLIDNNFSPVKDLARDPQGLYRLRMVDGDRSIKLRDDIRRYFRARNEDCIYNED